jgi:hypothetical protein
VTKVNLADAFPLEPGDVLVLPAGPFYVVGYRQEHRGLLRVTSSRYRRWSQAQAIADLKAERYPDLIWSVEQR